MKLLWPIPTLALLLVLPASAGVVAHWSFDQNPTTTSNLYLDGSGNSRHLSLVNTPAHTTNAIFGSGAVDLHDSEHDYLVFPGSNNRIDLDNRCFSVCFWIKRRSVTSGDFVIGQGEPNAYRALHIGFPWWNPTILTADFYEDALYVDSTANTDCLWHHYAFTYDAQTRIGEWYIDGAVLASKQYAGHFHSSGTSDFWVGSAYNKNETFDGLIDEVWVFDHTLTTDELGLLYSINVLTPPTLTVSSAHGAADPAVGTHEVAWGSNVECRVSGVETAGTTRYACTGWVGTGSVAPDGATTNTAFTITNDSSIAWQWTTNHWLEVGTEGQGQVTGGDAWVEAGADATLVATAATNWHFVGWTGDTGDCAISGNTLTAPMTQARSVTAVFEMGTLISALEAKLTAGDGAAGDWFGCSVRLNEDGSTALIGVPHDDTASGSDAGSAYVFLRNGIGWSHQAILNAGDSAANDAFGSAVGLSADGNTALVGVYGGYSGTGSAYVFVRNGSSWSEQAKLVAGDGANADFFGNSVSLSDDGNSALIGAVWDDTPAGVDAGSAYVFTRSGSAWSQQAKLTATDGADDDDFGWAVSLSGDGNTAIVGVRLDDTAAGVDSGSAYVFVRSGDVWSQQVKLTAEDAAASDYVGFSVSLSRDGDTALVGAIWDDTAAGEDAGSAYVFARNGTSWSQQGKLTASDGSYDDNLGRSVSLSGDGNAALVGCMWDDSVAGTNSGSAYLFVRGASNWEQRDKLTAADAAAGDYFGQSVSLSGDGSTVLVGAYLADTLAGTDAGSAYVFDVNLAAPAIVMQPPDTLAGVGEDAMIAAGVSGSAPLACQWYALGGSPVEGAVDDTLVLPAVTTAVAGSYYLVASNDFGCVTSRVARLVVCDKVWTGGGDGGDGGDGVSASRMGAFGDRHASRKLPCCSCSLWLRRVPQYGRAACGGLS